MSKLRILIVNVYFSPNSFGGATIIAEGMAKHLHNEYNFEPIVVAATDDSGLPPYHMRRYSTGGIDVVAVKVPPSPFDARKNWDNPEFNSVFADILDATQPDIIHLHSMHTLGVTLLRESRKRNIKVIVTMHDCWFICERQFMINNVGRYCFQEKIDLDVCRSCVPDPAKTEERNRELTSLLDYVDLFLFPSQFHLDLHVKNGFPAERCVVNKNGILPPQADFKRSRIPKDSNIKTRFGFFGGPGPIKGAHVMARAFKYLKRRDYEVRVIDAAQNISQSWRGDPVWEEIPGKVTFIPAYKQDTMDDVYRDIDVLLFPSQWKESFGLTVREAIKRNTWVVTTDAGGVIEDCIDGENSTIIPLDGDYKVLAATLEAILETPPPNQIPHNHINTVSQQAAELNTYIKSVLG